MKKIMSTSFTTTAVSFASIIALSGEANALVTLQPVAASTDMGEYVRVDAAGTLVFSASHVIDQSALFPHYTSNVTDLNSYIASNPRAWHGHGEATWGSFGGIRSGTFDLNLGNDYIVSAMTLWNLVEGGSGIREFNILLDDNSSFSSPARFNGFTASNTLSPDGYASSAQLFAFDPTIAHFVRLEILNTWSPSSFYASFNEVMFGVSPVPEPETYAMLLAGLGLVSFMARRCTTT